MNCDINTLIVQDDFQKKAIARQMKIMLIMFAPYRTVQMQIATLSAFLKKIDCKVKYVEVPIFDKNSFDRNKSVVTQAVEEFQPDLIGFSSYDMNYYFILECAKFIKSFYSKGKIIVGGHHASLAPEDYMKNEFIDYVCIGEGEYVLRDLLDALSKGVSVESVMGLCSRNTEGKIIYNRARNLIEDLDILPFIDRTVVDSQHREIDYLPILAGKGCPFPCTYCANDGMKSLYSNYNKYIRYRSPEKIIEEIKECSKVYKFNYVYFYDDIFALNYEWLQRFGKLYIENFPETPFYCLLRPETATNERYLRLLYDSGCRSIYIGVESGSQEYRRKMLNRKMTNYTILTAAKLIKKHGMKLYIFMMVGMPDESFLDMLKSLWLNFKIGAEGVQTGIYYPIKNTPLYKYCLEHNLISEERKKRIFIYTYNTCLNYGALKRGLIILFKWLNSGVPLLHDFKFSLILYFFKIQYRKWFKKLIDYK